MWSRDAIYNTFMALSRPMVALNTKAEAAYNILSFRADDTFAVKTACWNPCGVFGFERL